MKTEAKRYMNTILGHQAAIVDTIVRGRDALVLFDNDVCLVMRYTINDRWEVIDETSGDDFRRNK